MRETPIECGVLLGQLVDGPADVRQVRHEVAQLVGEAKERSDLCEVGWPGKGPDCCHFLWVGLHALVADDVACELDLGADGKLLA